MKSTGIIRRVDELGRVVIPKELRRTSFISVGTPLEIYVGDEGEIILKKYSLLKNLKNYADEIAESINSIANCKVAIYDRNEVISSSGISLKNATNIFIENRLDKIHNKSGVVDISITQNEIKTDCSMYFQPIRSEGNVIGGIMVWGIEKFSIDIVSSCQCMATYLGRMIS